MHMKIIGNDPNEYRALYRDYTACSLLNQTRTALNSILQKVRFKDRADIPDINPDNYGYICKYIARQERNDTNRILYSISESLSGNIDNFLKKVPEEHLKYRYNLTDNDIIDARLLKELSINQKDIVWEALYHNDYRDGVLFETPHGSWMFQTYDERNELNRFENLFNEHYFDPRLDFEKYIRSAVWFHNSQTPIGYDTFNPPKFPGNNLFPASTINPNDYFIREYSHTCNIAPSPEWYWLLFVRSDMENAEPNMSNNIATLLFCEQGQNIPNDCVELFLRSDFAREHREFSKELRKWHNLKDTPEYRDKLKTMATQIITECGLNIRGRQHTPCQNEKEQQPQNDDYFYPRAKRGWHV